MGNNNGENTRNVTEQTTNKDVDIRVSSSSENNNNSTGEFKDSVSKQFINTLEPIQFEGEIVIVDDEAALNAAVDYLSQFNILGFDTETKPSFVRGISNKTSLLQLSTRERCYIFKLKEMGLSERLASIISNKDIIKTGVNILGDIKDLKRLAKFDERSIVDISDLAKQKNFHQTGLRNLTAILFNKRLSKSTRTSNWGKKNLTEKQIIYAATDAWMSLLIYEKLSDIE